MPSASTWAEASRTTSPPDEAASRRLAIHTGDTNIYLETNLSREELLAVAASLPLDGRAIPASWTRRAHERRDDRTAHPGRGAGPGVVHVRRAADLPGGYVLASVERTVVRGADGVTLMLRQRDSDLGAGPIRIHLEAAAALPPAAAGQETVALGTAPPLGGRRRRDIWSGSTDGVLRSIDGPGLDLGTLTAVAASIEASA